MKLIVEPIALSVNEAHRQLKFQLFNQICGYWNNRKQNSTEL